MTPAESILYARIPSASPKRLLRRHVVASILSVSRQKIDELIQQGALKYEELRSPVNPARIHYLIKVDSLIEFMTKRLEQAPHE
jgi:hypothetical protein